MTVFRVSNQTELRTALAKASGGDTILLAGGNYGELKLSSFTDPHIRFPSNVTITSENASEPAVFSGLNIVGAKNLTFDGVVFDYTYSAEDIDWHTPFLIGGSENVSVINSVFDGDVAHSRGTGIDGLGFATGLMVRNSQGVTVDNNEIYGFRYGLQLTQSQDLLIRRNDLHSLRHDGIQASSIQGMVIEQNHIHDFIGRSDWQDHRDMIQFWTAGTSEATTDIVIRGNLLDVGNGDFTQTIFMGNEKVVHDGAGKEMFYRNILIEDNIIQNSHLHGITVGQTLGLTIRSNTVLYKEGASGPGWLAVPNIHVSSASESVIIQKNIASEILGYNGQTDWSLGKNAIVQHSSPEAPGWYGDVFISSTLADGSSGPVLLPGSEAQMLGAGAAQTRGLGLEGLSGRVHVTDFDDDAALRIFDARFSAADGKDLPAGTIYMWSFDDDSQYMGPVVGYRFAEGGTFDVRLTVMTPDGRSDSIEYAINVSGPEVVAFEAGGGFTAFEDGAPIDLPGSDTLSNQGLVLGGAGTSQTIRREYVDDVPGADDMTINFSIKSASSESVGEIFRLHESFAVGVQSDGTLRLDLLTADGKSHVISSSGIRLNDQAEHDVSIRLAEGEVRILVDNKVAAVADVTGVIAGSGMRDLIFGTTWGQNFDGLLTRFSLDLDSSDFTPVGESRGYAVVAESSSDWAMLCTPTQTDEVGTITFDTMLGGWVESSGIDDIIPMI